MREPLKKLLYKWINNRYDRNEATDGVISLIREEIEKVENPYEDGAGYLDEELAAEGMRDKILSLLGGKDGS